MEFFVDCRLRLNNKVDYKNHLNKTFVVVIWVKYYWNTHASYIFHIVTNGGIIKAMVCCSISIYRNGILWFPFGCSAFWAYLLWVRSIYVFHFQFAVLQINHGNCRKPCNWSNRSNPKKKIKTITERKFVIAP